MSLIMKQLSTFFILGIWINSTASAQVTYSEHIAPIIYENCTSCHREGEIAPFSLSNYEEAAAWSGMIQYVTEIQYMPPWKPDPSYSHFVGERSLSEEEIRLIAEWAESGAPQGNPDLEPPLPDFPSGSQLGTPDLVLEMTEEYFIEGNNEDDYRVFVLPTSLTEDKEIAAIEFRPGNNRAVHHALIAYDTEGLAAAKDAETPEYGYESFGDFGVQIQGTFTGYTPGIKSIFYPKGIGTTLPAGSDLLIQVHYAPLPTDETDKSLLNIFFKEENDPIVRNTQRQPATPFDLEGGFFSFVIPPNEVKTFHGIRQVEEDISLLSIYPHMHYLGVNWEIYAETATGDTLPIIRINDWDFNWQGSYTFDRMKKIPAGSTIHYYATYDNTSSNPFNPSNPPQTVRWGEGTTDEMFLIGMEYVPYQEGDEEIVMDQQNIATSNEGEIGSPDSPSFWVYPNPSHGEFILNYQLENRESIRIDLLDAKGVEVKSLKSPKIYAKGRHTWEIDVQDLPSGTYTIRLHTSTGIASQSIIVMK